MTVDHWLDVCADFEPRWHDRCQSVHVWRDCPLEDLDDELDGRTWDEYPS